jgi:N6-adenosine-specific RNA methylase IME4
MHDNWPRGKYRVIYCDPPWRFHSWDGKESRERLNCVAPGRITPYDTMEVADLAALPVKSLAAEDCCLFIWVVWPNLMEAIDVIKAWGFRYKTCAFSWIKAQANQLELFQDHHDAFMGLGYWTRANSEVCLLATRGKPKRLSAGVRQAIVEPRREHSRKPDCVYDRIEQLVEGPYIELFARRNDRPGWDFWGKEATKFNAPDPGNTWQDMWQRPFDFSALK